jgi:hypothetical protein
MLRAMSSRVQHVRRLAGALGLGLLACSKHPDDAPPPERASPAARPRELASATAFELTPAPAGALLAWVSREENRVRLERLDAAGRAERELDARGLSTGPHVAELAALATEAGVALAWSEAMQPSSADVKARVAWLAPGGTPQSYDLGPATRAPVPGRGDLALAARADGALVFARGAETACVDVSDEPCVAFNFFQLSAAGVAPSGIPLSVPSPCDTHAAQLELEPRGVGAAPGGFDYAVCSNARGSSELTIFSIRTSPAYAMSRQAFTGCTPLGGARFGGQATYVARCGQHRRIATADARDGELALQDIDERGLICREGSALVRFGSSWLRLDEAIGRLELLLSEDLAPPDSRAVWAGQALLVARALDGRLQLHRYVCRDSSVIELPGELDAGP